VLAHSDLEQPLGASLFQVKKKENRLTENFAKVSGSGNTYLPFVCDKVLIDASRSTKSY
jgi:hypothetical protein